jgi:hypothetical protein
MGRTIADYAAIPLADLADTLRPAASRTHAAAAYESTKSGELTEVATISLSRPAAHKDARSGRSQDPDPLCRNPVGVMGQPRTRKVGRIACRLEQL